MISIYTRRSKSKEAFESTTGLSNTEIVEDHILAHLVCWKHTTIVDFISAIGVDVFYH
jgi:hypothetical protein